MNNFSAQALILLGVLSLSVLGQTFDPYSGELINIEVDTSVIDAPKSIPVFDPMTGEVILPPSPSPQVVQSSSREFRFDPETGLPLYEDAKIDICVRAKRDALEDTSNLWYIGGIIYVVGIPVYVIYNPEPPPHRLLQMDVKDIIPYKKCYQKEIKMERGKRMLSGCGVYLGASLLLFGL